MSNADNTETVTVSILDKDYKINCSPEEVTALMQSSNYVDSKMREIKSGAAILSLDRIAVMTALNLANEFLAEKTKTNSVIDSKSDEINQLTAKLDQALIRLNLLIVKTNFVYTCIHLPGLFASRYVLDPLCANQEVFFHGECARPVFRNACSLLETTALNRWVQGPTQTAAIWGAYF